jgi:hypothetical protein
MTKLETLKVASIGGQLALVGELPDDEAKQLIVEARKGLTRVLVSSGVVQARRGNPNLHRRTQSGGLSTQAAALIEAKQTARAGK